MSISVNDFSQFAELRAAADRKDPAALKAVAQQFEGLFTQMMMKSMRAASFGDPYMGNNRAHELYQDMMDKQLSQDMSAGRGLGLAEIIVRQLGGSVAESAPSTAFEGVVRSGSAVPKADWTGPESFAESIWPHVQLAARKLNVSPIGILAQTALETGWGQKVMPRGDGSSLNLFGIKAGRAWNGDSVAKQTLEYRDGVAQRETARFRAYSDVSDAVADYTRLLSENARYEPIFAAGDDPAEFGRALQDSGYATDPNYADKIAEIADSPRMRKVLRYLESLSIGSADAARGDAK